MNIALKTALFLVAAKTAFAGDVEIVSAELHHGGNRYWSVSVTLKHADAGWEHYADGWRVVDADGNILGKRILHHPHVNEQPFTRSLRDVKIPEDITSVYIEAHDKVHGWSPNRLKVELPITR